MILLGVIVPPGISGTGSRTFRFLFGEEDFCARREELSNVILMLLRIWMTGGGLTNDNSPLLFLVWAHVYQPSLPMTLLTKGKMGSLDNSS